MFHFLEGGFIGNPVTLCSGKRLSLTQAFISSILLLSYYLSPFLTIYSTYVHICHFVSARLHSEPLDVTLKAVGSERERYL